jgi:hypothetical protein
MPINYYLFILGSILGVLSPFTYAFFPFLQHTVVLGYVYTQWRNKNIENSGLDLNCLEVSYKFRKFESDIHVFTSIGKWPLCDVI